MNALRFCAVFALILISGIGPILEVDAGVSPKSPKRESEPFKPFFEEVRYESSSRELVVKFEDGSAYIFRDVPVEIYKDLTRIVNQGEYFENRIFGQYVCERLPVVEGTELARR